MNGKKKEFVILFFIILIASFLRFSSFSKLPPGLYPDEAMNGSNALEANTSGIYKVFYPENNGREGLFINIQAFVLKFLLSFTTFPTPWMLHIPSAIFGICTVLGIYFLVRELPGVNNRAIPLLASFFAATSFWHINFSRIGFRAIMAPFFLVWSSYLLLLAFRKQKENPGRFRLYCIILPLFAGFVYGLGMHSYIAYRATPIVILAILIFGFFSQNKKNILVTSGSFIGGAIVSSLPLIAYFLHNPSDFLGRTSQVSIFSSSSPIQNLFQNVIKTFGMLIVYGDANWRHNLSGAPELFLPVAACFLVAFVIGCFSLFTKRSASRASYFILFVWLIAASAPVVVSNEGIPHALRSILLIPPAYILSAYGAYAVYKFLQSRNIRRDAILAVSFLFLSMTFFNAYYSYFVLWGENQNTKDAFAYNYVKIANEINALPAEIPKYIIVEATGTDVRGYPMPTQTVMFLTKSFLPNERENRNIHYIFPDQKSSIPEYAAVFEIK